MCDVPHVERVALGEVDIDATVTMFLPVSAGDGKEKRRLGGLKLMLDRLTAIANGHSATARHDGEVTWGPHARRECERAAMVVEARIVARECRKASRPQSECSTD